MRGAPRHVFQNRHAIVHILHFPGDPVAEILDVLLALPVPLLSRLNIRRCGQVKSATADSGAYSERRISNRGRQPMSFERIGDPLSRQRSTTIHAGNCVDDRQSTMPEGDLQKLCSEGCVNYSNFHFLVLPVFICSGFQY